MGDTIQLSTPDGPLEWPVLHRAGEWVMHATIGYENKPMKGYFTISHTEKGLRLITLKDEALARRMVDELGPIAWSETMDDETKSAARFKLKAINEKYSSICKCSKCKAEFSDEDHSHMCAKCRPVECKHCNGEGYIYP